MTQRITVIPVDGLVSVNGIVMSGLDLSFLPREIHAIQWNGHSGEVEFRQDVLGNKRPNEKIDSFQPYKKAVELFERLQKEEKVKTVTAGKSQQPPLSKADRITDAKGKGSVLRQFLGRFGSSGK